MRFLLLLLPLTLVACADPRPAEPLDAFRASYDDALAAGDVERAIKIVEARAKTGDVGAIGHLASIYDEGQVRAPSKPWKLGEPMRVRTWPGQARLWRARYERERDRQARAGDPDALFYAAQDLAFDDGPIDSPSPEVQAKRDSAHAIRQRLIAQGHTMALFSEAMNHSRGDSVRRDSLLAAAEAAGSFEACAWRAHFSTPNAYTAEAIASHVDRAEACRPLLGSREGHTFAESTLRSLRQGADNGTPEAITTLDSLRALGVFERHPHLAQI
ncbi:hypothetical protein [Rubricoccus marinus]|uniref:Sel1 repeat family protein n=1 Tax=Rubricoccus marinus TaxID=716817 RepID=A0A259TWQ7_9BACT|nr:hypothetical protein [Rubricoccus marinus]OZC02126.1 hypothetical protein BSZ36_03475 [Rubricoccus marinus]